MRTVIVTGGRNYKDAPLVYKMLTLLDPEVVIEGGCPTGADKFARDWAKSYIPNKDRRITYEADWNGLGKAAGPIRNRTMVSENPSAVLLAFPGNSGTENCISEARKLGLIIIRAER